MNLKYKKMILLLTAAVMGIGMVTFSFRSTNRKSATDSNLTEEAIQSAAYTSEKDDTPTPEPTAPVTLTPTPVPKNDLELNKYPEINEVVEAFYNARLTCAAEDFEPILLNADQLDMDRLQRKIEYVEDYANINCYTKKGINEIDYIVYVCYDLKLTTIDTYAPSIDELRITYVDGKPYIFLGEISEETSAYLEELRTNEDVQLLVSDVVTRLDEACESDESLNEFYQNLTKTNSAESESSASKDSSSSTSGAGE